MANNIKELAIQTFCIVPEIYQQAFKQAGADFPDELVQQVKEDPQGAMNMLAKDEQLTNAVVQIFQGNQEAIMQAAEQASQQQPMFKKGGKLEQGLQKFQNGGVTRRQAIAAAMAGNNYSRAQARRALMNLRNAGLSNADIVATMAPKTPVLEDVQVAEEPVISDTPLVLTDTEVPTIQRLAVPTRNVVVRNGNGLTRNSSVSPSTVDRRTYNGIGSYPIQQPGQTYPLTGAEREAAERTAEQERVREDERLSRWPYNNQYNVLPGYNLNPGWSVILPEPESVVVEPERPSTIDLLRGHNEQRQPAPQPKPKTKPKPTNVQTPVPAKQIGGLVGGKRVSADGTITIADIDTTGHYSYPSTNGTFKFTPEGRTANVWDNTGGFPIHRYADQNWINNNPKIQNRPRILGGHRELAPNSYWQNLEERINNRFPKE